MLEAAIHEEAKAALNRVLVKHTELKEKLEKAHAYIVFPSVGRAGVVLGGSYGQGEVYERGKPAGFATLTQMTIGVQVGGQTFTQLVIFQNQSAFDDFKHRSKLGFSANASAAILKAAASGTSDSSGVEAMAFSLGGLLLELSLGGSKLLYVPPTAQPESKQEGAGQRPEIHLDQTGEQSETEPGADAEEAKPAEAKPRAAVDEAKPANGGIAQKLGRLPLVNRVVSPAERVVAKVGTSSGVSKVLSGLKKEVALNETLNKDVRGALTLVVEKNPEFRNILAQAYGYAVFPAVGRASLVLGGSYGKGQVFKRNKLVGYASIVQVSLGVQLGGETLIEIVTFSDKEAMNRFKQGGVSLAANASAVIVKAGASTTTRYKSDQVYLFSRGGLLIEASIGVQKIVFRTAFLTRGESAQPQAASAGAAS